jgi:hypothetical protein
VRQKTNHLKPPRFDRSGKASDSSPKNIESSRKLLEPVEDSKSKTLSLSFACIEELQRCYSDFIDIKNFDPRFIQDTPDHMKEKAFLVFRTSRAEQGTI